MQRRHYPREPHKGYGQVNFGRLSMINTPSGYMPLESIKEGSVVETVGTDTPNCVIFVSKRRGWGSTGNHESEPVPLWGAKTLEKQLPGKLFMRYKVNIYLKR